MESPSGPREFATTHWSLIVAASHNGADRSGARRALEELCRSYWYPLYAFARRSGYSAADSQDLTQAFFARILEKGGFTSADPERGRFRSYLLGALKHFVANEWHRASARKRGGDVMVIAWEALDPEGRYAGGSATPEDADSVFDRDWALETVGRALAALRIEMERAGKGDLFDELRGTLTGVGDVPRRVLSQHLGMTEGAVKVAIHRLRRRYRDLLRQTVAETVRDGSDLDDEIRHLVHILRKN